MKTEIWTNNRYGPSDIFLWVVLVCWLVVLYTIYYWTMNINLFDSEKPFDLFIIDILVLVVEILLAVFFLFFFFQCIRTVGNIYLDDNQYVRAKLFFGRNIKFKIENIDTIRPFVAKGVRFIYTPFESEIDNYRIDFKDGGHIFISGSMNGVQELIGELERRRNGQSVAPAPIN